MIYADYSKYDYYSAVSSDKQVREIINSYKDNGNKVAGSEANAFAATMLDHIYDVPTNSSEYRFYSETIPFYEIVFKGYKSMSGRSVNLCTDSNEQFLKCVESGIGLTYSLVEQYPTDLVNSYQNVYYGSVYEEQKENIVNTVEKYKGYFEKVKGATIVSNEIVAENVHRTEFDNGVVVYVNYSTYDYQTEDGTVAAGNYLVK